MELRCRERPAEPQSVRSRERSQHDKERHYQKQQFGGILAIRRRESALRTFAGNSSVTASLAIVSNKEVNQLFHHSNGLLCRFRRNSEDDTLGRFRETDPRNLHLPHGRRCGFIYRLRWSW